MSLSKINNDLIEYSEPLSVGGTANTLTYDPVIPISSGSNCRIRAKIVIENTGAATLQVTGWPVWPIVKINGQNLISGDLPVNFIADLQSDVTNTRWILMNPLSHFGDGLFTPIAFGTTAAGSGTYTVQNGRYTLLGDRCFFDIQVVWSAHTGTGDLKIGGLPFVNSGISIAVPCYLSNISISAGNNFGSLMVFNSDSIILNQIDPATGTPSAIPMDTSGGVYLNGSFKYR